MAYLLLVFTLLLAACGSSLRPLELEEIHNLREAPESIRRAGDAVMKLCTGDSCGTATALSYDGLILTNNHVLGIENCAKEGCHATVSTDFQLGGAGLTIKVYAVPVASSHALDVSFVQLWRGSELASKFGFLHVLEFADSTPGDLVGRKVHVVGHPVGALKKWTSGPVFQNFRNWFFASMPILPGNSGSPVLSEEGKIVGIVHHAMNYPTSRGTGIDFAGTASRPIMEFRAKGPTPDAFYSIEKPHEVAEVLDHQSIYRAAKKNEALLKDGTKTPILEMLTSRCDEFLQKADQLSEKKFREEIAWCKAAMHWANQDPSGVSNKARKHPADSPAWDSRFEKITERVAEQDPFSVFAWMNLAKTLDEDPQTGLSKGTRKMARMEKMVADSKLRLSIDLAYLLLDTKNRGKQFDGRNLYEYLRDYKSVGGYGAHLQSVVSAHILFYNARWMTRSQVINVFSDIFADSKAPIDEKLRLEADMFNAGWLGD